MNLFNTPFTQRLIVRKKLSQDKNRNNYVDLVVKTC